MADFEVGETVRNRRTGAVLAVDEPGVWLPFWYERVVLPDVAADPDPAWHVAVNTFACLGGGRS
jgi:hypothetical protein